MEDDFDDLAKRGAKDFLEFMSGNKPDEEKDPMEYAFYELRRNIFFQEEEFSGMWETDNKGRHFYYSSWGEDFHLYAYVQNSILHAIAIPVPDYEELTPEDIKEIEQVIGIDWKEQNEQNIALAKEFFDSKGVIIYEDGFK